MDLAKRKAIQDKTGFNVSRQIEINFASKENNAEETEVKKRRVAIKEDAPAENPGRRTAAPEVEVEVEAPAEEKAPMMSATKAAVEAAKAEVTSKYTIKTK